MDCSTPGFPVHHQLPELTQTHARRVSNVIHPSHPLLSPSPPAFNLSQHQGLLQWVSSACHCMPRLVLKWVYYEEELNPTSLDFSFLSTVHNIRQLKKTHSLWLAWGLGDSQGSMVWDSVDANAPTLGRKAQALRWLNIPRKATGPTQLGSGSRWVCILGKVWVMSESGWAEWSKEAEGNSLCGFVKRGLGWVSGTGLFCSAVNPAGARCSMPHCPPDGPERSRPKIGGTSGWATTCEGHRGKEGWSLLWFWGSGWRPLPLLVCDYRMNSKSC